MASETYFALGARVRFNPEWCDETLARMLGLTTEDVTRINALVGTVVEVDDSPRECAYYTVAWDGAAWGNPTQRLLSMLSSVEPCADGRVTSCEQSDALLPA